MRIIATNSKGQQLKSGQWWAILKPIPEPTVAKNVVYHVGQEKYIRRIWDKQFKSSGLTNNSVSGTIET